MLVSVFGTVDVTLGLAVMWYRLWAATPASLPVGNNHSKQKGSKWEGMNANLMHQRAALIEALQAF